jgi:hypothetical protein
VDQKVVSRLLEAGVNPAHIQAGAVLPSTVQDFIKSFIVWRSAGEVMARSVRNEAKHLRSFWSATEKEPWDIGSEDVQRYIDMVLPSHREIVSIQAMVRMINENMLSYACPIELGIANPIQVSFQMQLDERRARLKLPEKDALFEAVRIAFQEQPLSHHDRLRFAVLRVLVLTGLRLNEVLMLPADCCVWQEHVDIVTGKNAEEIGGIGRSLVLHFFPEKQSDSAPDVLAEDVHHVPDRFAELVYQSLAEILAATTDLRRVLREQHRQPDLSSHSDLRTFKTASGKEFTTADLLFLMLTGSSEHLPPRIEEDAAISPIASSSFYQFVGVRGAPMGMFVKYARSPETVDFVIRPHSLRHLMNTELFRQALPDTIITHQFHRQTIAQSYEYDHRTLAERLEFVTLPEVAYDYVERETSQELVARMVVTGAAGSSRIVRTFEKIRREAGEPAAFAYLVANSDGFHATPYGLCINSFSVNPCSRHLKCFNDCRHFVASGAPAHIESLQSLREKLRQMRNAALARKANTVGRSNQIVHAEQLMSGVDRALASRPGEIVFPDGEDHSVPRPDLFE